MARDERPLLTALLMGSWITVYFYAALIALEDLIPALVKFFPPLFTTLTFWPIPVIWIYLTPRSQ